MSQLVFDSRHWELLEPLVPALSPEVAYHVHERRESVNAILYVLRSGCPWRMLPHEFPAWGTVYYYFREWEREGTWDQILCALRMQVRRKYVENGAERKSRVRPSSTVNRSKPVRCAVPKRATIWGEKIWGGIRHALVDTQGHLLAVQVTRAESSDQKEVEPCSRR